MEAKRRELYVNCEDCVSSSTDAYGLSQSDTDVYGDGVDTDTDTTFKLPCTSSSSSSRSTATSTTSAPTYSTSTCASTSSASASTSTSASTSAPSSTASTSSSAKRKAKGSGSVRGLNFFRLCSKLKDNDSSLQFCKDTGLIASEVKCPSCQSKLDRIYETKRGKRKRKQLRFQCNKRQCRRKPHEVSVRKGSWFNSSNLSFRKSLLLTYSFIHKLQYNQAIHESSISSGDSETEKYVTTSSETVADYYNYCREVCEWAVENKLHSNNPIGGPGKIVEIEESKFGKRKFNKGRIVEGQWVFGGICRETKEVFLVPLPNNKRDRATLEPIITSHIKPGTTIISDCWKAYDQLSTQGFQHLTVNHSYNFVDPTSGAYTNNIENLWWQVKRQLSQTHTHQNKWSLHLNEYMWRHSHAKEDLFEAFLNDVKDIFKPGQ